VTGAAGIFWSLIGQFTILLDSDSVGDFLLTILALVVVNSHEVPIVRHGLASDAAVDSANKMVFGSIASVLSTSL